MSEQRTHIPLGDLLKSVSTMLFKELEVMLGAMCNMDPETRTVQMRSYVSRARKILCQVYALTRWISTPRVNRLFASVNDIGHQLGAVDLQLREGQDTLYFIHASLYNKRSRKLEVDIAKDVLARGTYIHLPAAAMNGGMAEPPDLVPTSQLLDDVNLAIRAKLLLHDRLPADFASSVLSPRDHLVENGLLLLHHRRLYELVLTLTCVHEEAAWTVVSCKVLVESDTRERFFGSYDHRTVERQLLETLRTQLGSYQSDKLLLEGSDVEPVATQPKRQRSSKSVVASLSAFHAVCLHTATAVAQRLLWAQALDLMNGLWKGAMDVDFRSEFGNTYVSVKFWRGIVSKAFQFELRIMQARKATAIGREALYCDLFGGPGYVAPTSIAADPAAPISSLPPNNPAIETNSSVAAVYNCAPCCPGFSDAVVARNYIIDGVAFSTLWSEVIAFCSKNKLMLLRHRLLATPIVIDALTHGLDVSQTANSVKLSWGPSCFTFAVDCRSGQYTIVGANTSDINAQGSQTSQSFLAEINDLEMELRFQKLLLLGPSSVSDGSPFDHSSAYKSIAGSLLTVNPLLCALYASSIAIKLKPLFPVTNMENMVAPLLRQLELSSDVSCGLVFNATNVQSATLLSSQLLRSAARSVPTNAAENTQAAEPLSVALGTVYSQQYNSASSENEDKNGTSSPQPDLAVYFVVFVTHAFTVTTMGVICRQAPNKRLAVPTVYRSVILDADLFKAVVEGDGNHMEIEEVSQVDRLLASQLSAFLAWKKEVLYMCPQRSSAVVLGSLGFHAGSRELYRPSGNRVAAAGSTAPRGGHSLAVLHTQGRQMSIELYFLRSLQSQPPSQHENVDRICKLIAGQPMSSSDYSLICDTAECLGFAVVSIHNIGFGASIGDHVMHVDGFQYHGQRQLISPATYTVQARELMQLCVHPRDEDNDDNDGDASPVTPGRNRKDAITLQTLKERLLDGISKTCPMLCLLWMASLHDDSKGWVGDRASLSLAKLHPVTVVRNPLPRALFIVNRAQTVASASTAPAETSTSEPCQDAQSEKVDEPPSSSEPIAASDGSDGSATSSVDETSSARVVTLPPQVTHPVPVGFVEIAFELMFGVGAGMTLVPSSKCTVKDLAAAANYQQSTLSKSSITFANIDVDEMMNSTNVMTVVGQFAKMLADKMIGHHA